MKKALVTPYTIVWVDIPDQPAEPPRSRGTRAPGAAGIAAWRRAKARIARALDGARGGEAVAGLATVRN